MKAIILAAGQSLRLRPITNEKPKCMLQVGRKIIIDHQIETLLAHGVKETVVVTGYYAEKLTHHLETTHPEMQFTFVHNERYAETYPAYGLWMVKDHLLSGTCLYLNSDVLFDRRIIQSVIDAPQDSVTAIQRVRWDEEEVNVTVSESGAVTEMGKHLSEEESYAEFIGVTKIGGTFNKTLTQVLETFIEQNELKKFAADSLNGTIQSGESMHIVDVTEYPAIEIDTPEDYEKAQSLATLLWE